MVPIVIFKTKDMRNSTNIFLVNLSVADLMVLLVCTPTVLVEVNSRPETWVLGKEMCKLLGRLMVCWKCGMCFFIMQGKLRKGGKKGKSPTISYLNYLQY